MNVFRENTPLKENDICVVLDSCNNGFDYPLHNHPETEITLIQGMSGHRIVGSSKENYYNNDLVLLGPYVNHKWYGDEELQSKAQPYRVITIQFDANIFTTGLLTKNSFYAIRQMLNESVRGIQFEGNTFQAAEKIMVEMTENKGFENTMSFFKLLETMAKGGDKKYLSGLEIENNNSTADNRMQIVYAYLLSHYTDANFKIKDVADQIKMSENAFSRFFKKNCFRSFSDFLIDMRLSKACKLLIESDKTVGEICYMTGFNNLANFNRLFKKHRQLTPIEFRKANNMDAEFAWDRQTTPWQFVPANINSNSIIKPKNFSTRILHM